MPNRQITLSVTARLNRAHLEGSPMMSWERLKEKLRAHGVPGRCDEASATVARPEGRDQLAAWDNEGGSIHGRYQR